MFLRSLLALTVGDHRRTELFPLLGQYQLQEVLLLGTKYPRLKLGQQNRFAYP